SAMATWNSRKTTAIDAPCAVIAAAGSRPTNAVSRRLLTTASELRATAGHAKVQTTLDALSFKLSCSGASVATAIFEGERVPLLDFERRDSREYDQDDHMI